MIDVFRRDAAGRSAERRHGTLATAWRRRVFGRRASLSFWTIYGLLLVLVVRSHLGGSSALGAGLALGAAGGLWLLLPDTLMPRHIFNWQLGAWGEQSTAKELRRLRREGWAIRHDVRWGERTNHDHVVAGPAVYVLNTKNVADSVVTIEGRVPRVTPLEDERASYLADRWLSGVEAEARTLHARLDRELGFPVAVYPVVVLWGRFPPGEQWVGNVCVVVGNRLVDLLRSRPTDLRDDAKRRRVADWVRALPQA